MNLIQSAYKSNKSHKKSHNKSFNVSILMIKLQGIDKLQHYFENSSLAGAKNYIEMNTFGINIVI